MNAAPAVLVVDDELAIRRFLRLSLETNDYRIYEAENGRNGLAKAAQFRPEVPGGRCLTMLLPELNAPRRIWSGKISVWKQAGPIQIHC